MENLTRYKFCGSQRTFFRFSLIKMIQSEKVRCQMIELLKVSITTFMSLGSRGMLCCNETVMRDWLVYNLFYEVFYLIMICLSVMQIFDVISGNSGISEFCAKNGAANCGISVGITSFVYYRD